MGIISKSSSEYLDVMVWAEQNHWGERGLNEQSGDENELNDVSYDM